MDDDRRLNLHMDPEGMAGVYANFANVSFSDYEFTVTFGRVDFESDQGEIPGVVVARVNMSTQFMARFVEAINDSYTKWQIKTLPETGPADDS